MSESEHQPTDGPSGPFTDDELAALALQADPTECLAADATPVRGSVPADDGPLPGWYMPAPQRTVRSTRRTTIVIGLVLAFLIINVMGYCITYGILEYA